jgi:hypothetical protein
MFANWHDFYILVGSASGALIGLLFIVVTLTSNMDRDQALKGASRYMTPTVVEFTAVLLTGAIASAPLDGRLQQAALIALAAVLLAWSLVNCWRMFLRPMGASHSHWTDPWSYAAAPAASYLALGVAALFNSAPMVGVVAAVLLVCGIRNAWDLITWIAPRAGAAGSLANPPEQ